MNEEITQNIEIISPNMILEAYSNGYFPMADDADGKVYWYSPDPRAIFPIYDIKAPRSVRQVAKKSGFSHTVNADFEFVIRACAARDSTWISEEIIQVYLELFNLGFGVSIETWKDNKIVGGLYGVSIGKAFFGESMFTNVSGASKAAFYYLVELLKQNKYILLDSQFINDHTKLLGAIEISQIQYLKLLKIALLGD